MSESEQWKSGGDCGKCRREKYCGAKCRERRRIETLREKEAFLRAMTMLANAKPLESGEEQKVPEDGERPEEKDDGG